MSNNFYISGFGHIVPVTPLGKIMSIFYAVFGVPLFLLYLSNIGQYLHPLDNPNQNYVKFLCCVWGALLPFGSV